MLTAIKNWIGFTVKIRCLLSFTWIKYIQKFNALILGNNCRSVIFFIFGLHSVAVLSIVIPQPNVNYEIKPFWSLIFWLGDSLYASLPCLELLCTWINYGIAFKVTAKWWCGVCQLPSIIQYRYWLWFFNKLCRFGSKHIYIFLAIFVAEEKISLIYFGECYH